MLSFNQKKSSLAKYTSDDGQIRRKSANTELDHHYSSR